jgi:hypothetical protein
VVGDEGNVDIGLSDEESLHSFSVMSLGGPGPGVHTLALVIGLHSLKLFANRAAFAA